MEQEEKYITIGIYLRIWKKLMQLKIDKDLKTHNDVIDYLIKIEKEAKKK